MKITRNGRGWAWMLAHVLVLSACSPRYPLSELGPGPTHDPRVTVFRADRQTSWNRFRLGGGLNVVVVNPALPREFGWRFATGGISSSPTVMGTTILVSANDDHLYAIDAATGALQWRYRAENEIMSQPAYAHGLIFVGIGNPETVVYDVPHYCTAGSGMNKLEAIDARNGIEQWWSALSGTGMPSSAIVGDSVISVDGGGEILSVNAGTGAYRWDTSIHFEAGMSSVVAGDSGEIYVSGGCPNTVYSLRENDGSIVWKHFFNPLDGALGDDPLASTSGALIGDYLEPVSPGPFGMTVTYGSTARQHAYALSKRDGHVLWDTLLPGVHGFVPERNEAAIGLIYGGHVYVGSAVAPIITALDASNGKILWQHRVNGLMKGGIVAKDNVIYLGDLAGTLWALDAQSGRAIGSIATDMQFGVGSPIIVNESLVDGGERDVIAVPLSNIRRSQAIAGVTRLTRWEQLGYLIARVFPRRDPHREAAYYRTNNTR